jgi:hypothetical protein
MAREADPQAQFWQWFRSNGARLRAAMYGEDHDAREEASEELREAIGGVQEGLILEIASPPTEEIGQLVVSADGHRELVDTVKDFVAAAPDLPGWEVVAFRPRMPIADDMAIHLEDEAVSPDDIWFMVGQGEDGLDLTLHVRGLTEENKKLRGLGAMLLAEHMVGELDALTLLDSLDVAALPDDPAEEGLLPLSELPAIFDQAKEEKFPPPGSLALDEAGWQGLEGTISGVPAVALLNTALQGVVGHPDYDHRLVVTIPYRARPDGMPASDEEYDAVQELGSQLGEELEEGQESLLAITIMTGGRRELILYTHDAPSALQRLEDLRAEAPRDFEADVQRDTFWGMYRAFIQGAQEGEEIEEDEE